MITLRRLFKLSGTILLAVLGLLLLALAWLLMTTSGARLAAAVAESVEPRLELRVTGGNLARGVEVADVGWRDERVDVAVTSAALVWQPQRLLAGEARVDSLRVSGVEVTVAEGEEPPVQADPEARDEPLTLPRIELPLAVDVEKLLVEQVTLTFGDAPAQRIKRLETAWTAFGTEWRIHRLLVERDDARVELEGSLHTAESYPLSLFVRGTAAAPGLPERLRFASRFGGSVAALRVTSTLAGPVSGAIDLDIQPLDPQLPLRIETEDLDGGWPLDTRGVVAAEGLNLTAEGDLDGLRGTLDTDLTGEHVPRGYWRSRFEVDAEGARLTDLRGELLGGELEGQARLGWDADGVRWDVTAEAVALDPSLEWPQAPQGVSGPLSVRGQAGGEGWALTIDTPGLSGELHGRAVAVRGRGEHTLDEVWRLSGIEARVDGGEVLLDGALAETWDVELRARLSDLGALDERLGGALEAHARVRGAPDALDIESAGRGRGLRYDAYHIDALDWQADVPALAQQPGDAVVQARGIELPQGGVDELEMRATGSRAAHHLGVRLHAPEGQGHLGVAGGWQPEFGWSGLLVDAGGEFRDHRVRLDAPFPMRYADEELELGAQCWRYRDARLQLPDGVRAGPEGADLRFLLEGFDLAWVEPWLPAGVDWEGGLSGDGAVRWTPEEGVDARVRAESLDGRLALTLHDEFDDGDPVIRDVDYQRLAVQGRYRPDEAEAQLDFEAADAGNAALRVRGDPRADGEAVAGELRVDGLRVGFFRPLVPDLSELAGEVNARAQLTGTRSDPRLAGRVELRDGIVAAPQSASRVEDLGLWVAFDGDQADIGGGFRVGDGQARIQGDAAWNGDDWRVDLGLDGDELWADVPPFAELAVSPRLNLAVRPGQVRVGGQVQVPRGAIAIRELPDRAVGHSRDVVVVRRDEEAPALTDAMPEGWQVEGDVELALGDAVTLAAFGVRGRLGGALRVLQQPDGSTEAYGELRVEDGEYRAYGQRLAIRRGLVLFAGPLDRPQLDIEAVRRIERDRVTAGIRVGGFADEPQVTLFSEPTMSQENALSYLIRGRPMGAEGPGTDEMLASAALALGLYGGAGVVTAAAEQVGIRDFDIDTAGEGEDAQVVLSGYITPRLYVAYGVAVFSPVNTVTLRYYLTWQLYLEAVSGEDSALDLMYRFDID
ncbi:MAG: translocation/assembly module TamB domain-containing protein [Halorhodospira halophila]|uniref:translocation/assembly module TamB domain-containing protein n=1 Tax=Halorhodospira halophila TaxID=1053 RepID=UPI0026EC626B|nr:translocation/assembly module TamB domain-containing protein [Halorhodospira halophila]MCC3750071.1 translocation/assembly module TamB domain-containing protein [Halorhodospira halophila]